MGVIFTQNQVGSTVGIKTTNALPAAFAVKNDTSRSRFSGDVSEYLRDAGSSAYNWHKAKVEAEDNALYAAETERYGFSYSRSSTEDFDANIRNLEMCNKFWFGGDSEDGIKNRKSYLTDGAEKDPVEQSLVASLGDGKWGFITSLQGGFDEAFAHDAQVIQVSDAVVGEWKITGIAFAYTCETTEAQKLGLGRHGLEGPLWWYYYNRASYRSPYGGTKPSSITLRVGGTKLVDCFVVGISVFPQNLDINMWGWEIRLAVSPKYKPQALTA